MSRTDGIWADEADRRRDALIALRRDFHRHPELSFEERRTAEVVAARASAHARHAGRHVVGSEALEAPAQEQLVARARVLELEADAVGLQVVVAALVPELRHQVRADVRALVRRGLGAPGEADARLARREHAVEQIARGVYVECD